MINCMSSRLLKRACLSLLTASATCLATAEVVEPAKDIP